MELKEFWRDPTTRVEPFLCTLLRSCRRFIVNSCNDELRLHTNQGRLRLRTWTIKQFEPFLKHEGCTKSINKLQQTSKIRYILGKALSFKDALPLKLFQQTTSTKWISLIICSPIRNWFLPWLIQSLHSSLRSFLFLSQLGFWGNNLFGANSFCFLQHYSRTNTFNIPPAYSWNQIYT